MSQSVTLPHCRVDLVSRRITAEDTQLARLSVMEAELLGYLARRAGQVVSSDQLLRDVWGAAPTVAASAVDTTLQRLRKSIEPNPHAPRHLHRVGQKGWRFDPHCTQLGLDEAQFFGRGEAMASLRGALGPGAVLTVVGPPGVGKSRVADRLFDAVRDDRRLRVSLASQGGPPSFAIARAMGLSLARARTEAAVDSLVSEALAERGPVLLLLDDVDDAAAAVAQGLPRWRAAAPKAQVVVTARQALSLPGERLVSMPGLAPEAAVELLDHHLTDRVLDEPRSRRLAARLEHSPLALRLVAPLLALQGVDNVLRQLDEAQDERTEYTLDAAIALAFDNLLPDEQSVLGQACVFLAPFSMSAAESVLQLDDGDAADALAGLVLSGLVEVEPGSPRRLSVPRRVRELLSARRLHRPARERHATWFAARAAQAALSRDTPGWHWWKARVAEERADLLAAYEQQTAPDKRATLALRLSEVLPPDEPVPNTTARLEAAARRAPGRLRRQLEARRAEVVLESGRLDLAMGELATIRRVVKGQRAWQQLGHAHLQRSQLGKADECFQRALAEAGDDARQQALVQLDLGLSARIGGRLDEAREVFDEARRQLEELDDELGIARADAHVAAVDREAGHPQDATQLLDACIPVLERYDDTLSLAHALRHLAWCHLDRGRPGQAEATAQRAALAFRQAGQPTLRADHVRALATRDRGHWSNAAQELRALAQAAHEGGYLAAEAELLRDLGVVLLLAGQSQAATAPLLRAVELSGDAGDLHRGLALAWQAISMRQDDEANAGHALSAARRALGWLESPEARRTLAWAEAMVAGETAPRPDLADRAARLRPLPLIAGS